MSLWSPSVGAYALAGALALVVVRRLFFHPLSGFPGPKLAAATGLYKIWHDVIRRGELLHHLEALHLRYGPVVRIAPNALSFNDPAAYFDIYSTGSTFTKEPELYKCFAMPHSSLALLSPEDSKNRREMVSPFFARRAILSLQDVIATKASTLVSRLKSAPAGQPINMFWAFRCASIDIITSYVFAQCMDTLDTKGFFHPFPIGIQTQVHVLWTWKYLPFIIPTVLGLPAFIMNRLKPLLGPLASALTVREQVSAHIDAVMADNKLLDRSDREVIYHYLLRPANGSAPLSKRSLLDETLILVQAGSDTVGTACYVGTFHVLNNENVRQRLVSELKEAWPEGDTDIGLQTLEELPYLTAVIKESLRLSYGVVTPLPRVVGPEDALVNGIQVPAGTVVGMSCVWMHNDPSVFPDPHLFMPERWLGPNTTKMERYLVPFSRGPRMCIGLNLAWAELYILFGYVFRRLDMKIHNTTIEDFTSFKEMFVPVFEGNYFHAIIQNSTKQ